MIRFLIDVHLSHDDLVALITKPCYSGRRGSSGSAAVKEMMPPRPFKQCLISRAVLYNIRDSTIFAPGLSCLIHAFYLERYS